MKWYTVVIVASEHDETVLYDPRQVEAEEPHDAIAQAKIAVAKDDGVTSDRGLEAYLKWLVVAAVFEGQLEDARADG